MNLSLPEVPGFQIEKRLGAGSFATVYLARNPRGEFCALKVLDDRLTAGHDLQQNGQRFFDEITATRMLLSLNCPSCPVFYGAGIDHDGTNYLATEYIPGIDVSTLLRRLSERGHCLPVDLALAIIIPVLQALSSAHNYKDTRGDKRPIYHRDIKPANVMISALGGVYLLDWGIAKREAAMAHTMQGLAVGTPYVMAPEQVMGLPVDARTDVYGTGALLWTMLAGRKLFNHKTIPAVMQAVARQEPLPIKELRPEIPESISEAISKALAKQQGDRHESARDFQDALLFPGPGALTNVPAPASRLAALLRIYFPEKMKELSELTPDLVPQDAQTAPDTVSDAPVPTHELQHLRQGPLAKPQPLPSGAYALDPVIKNIQSQREAQKREPEPTIEIRPQSQSPKPEDSSSILYQQKVENLGPADSLHNFVTAVEDGTDDTAPTPKPPSPDATLSPLIIEERALSGVYEPVVQLSQEIVSAVPDTSNYQDLGDELPTPRAQPQTIRWVLQGMLLGAAMLIVMIALVLTALLVLR